PGVVQSGRFVGWLNGHPDHADASFDLVAVRSAVVIGNGNVALDVVRLLAKTPAELAQSDIAPAVERALAAMPLETIHIVGRRGPAEAGFSPHELGELGALARAQPIVDDADLPAADAAPNKPVIAILADPASPARSASRPRISSGRTAAKRSSPPISSSPASATARLRSARWRRKTASSPMRAG